MAPHIPQSTPLPKGAHVALQADELSIIKTPDSQPKIAIRFSEMTTGSATVVVPSAMFTQLLSVVAFAAQAAEWPEIVTPGTISISSVTPANNVCFNPPDDPDSPTSHAVLQITFGKATFQISAPTSAWLSEVGVLVNSRVPATKRFSLSVSPDGVWHSTDPHESDLIENLSKDSDRAVALIAGAMIEARLKDAILSRCKHNSHIRKRVLHYSGPLGTFSAKIDFAYMLGIVSHRAHSDLRIMRDIRNQFAHHLDVKDFSSGPIKSLLDKLSLVDTHVDELDMHRPDKLVDFDINAIPKMRVHRYKEKVVDPRQRYILMTQLLTVSAVMSDVPGAQIPFL